MGRRKSNIYQLGESKGQTTPQQISLATDNFNKKKPTITSEKISPARQQQQVAGPGHQKKPSYPISLDLFSDGEIWSDVSD